MKPCSIVLCSVLVWAALPVWSSEPAAQETQQIKAKLAALDSALKALREAKVDDDLIVDAEVVKHAVELAPRFPEERKRSRADLNPLAGWNDLRAPLRPQGR